MTQKLSELSKVKQQLRNEKTKYNNQKNRALKYEKLYKEEKQKKLELENKNKELIEEIKRHKQTIEEYKRMLFHKKSKNKNNNWNNCWNNCWCNDENSEKVDNSTKEENKDDNKNEENKTKKKTRNKETYQKKIPNKSKITNNIEYKISKCPECWSALFNLKKYTRYVEDIDSRFVYWIKNKNVIEEIIWSWFCTKCRKNRSKKAISKIPVTYWENIRMFINFQITIMKISYRDVINFLRMMHGIEMSEWEIARILEREALILSPEYERIREIITSQKWVHFDETWWIVQKDNESKYAWWMTWTETRDVLFELWLSRWWWAVKMLAQNALENEEDRKNKTQNNPITKFVWISDNYWWYTNKFWTQQLCWAHPDRKLRDLAETKSLDKNELEKCIKTSEDFSKLYARVRKEMKKEESRIEKWNESNEEEMQELKNKLMEKFLKIAKVNKNDPKKLITYKETLARYCEKYFVCILMPWIPADNNKAERMLRHLVLKRKVSNGSISNESAKIMSVNFSVLLSLYRHGWTVKLVRRA